MGLGTNISAHAATKGSFDFSCVPLDAGVFWVVLEELGLLPLNVLHSADVISSILVDFRVACRRRAIIQIYSFYILTCQVNLS